MLRRKLLQKCLVVTGKFKYKILAKPSGITLERHREDVMSEGELLSISYPYTFQKYEKRTGKSLKKRIEHVINFHDDGKDDRLTTNRWQKACQIDYENYLRWKSKFGGSFQDYASKNPNEAGMNLRKCGVRHEFQSLVINQKKKLPICLQAAIAAHHGKLGFRYEDRWVNEGVEAFWKDFQRESNRAIDERMNLHQVVEMHYEFAGPRGYLQLADHRASAIEDDAPVPPHRHFKYDFPYESKRNVQKLVDNFWKDDLLLIRAATGAGKTDASLLWASKQIENGRAERLVIAMPTRFTSNALAINVTENLSSTGLYHSSAWFTQFHNKIKEGEIEKKQAQKEHEFARLLQTPITVCTIDHLLMSLTLTREDHHLITFNLANSCLVIDEADFYDDFTQANILVLLEILKASNVPILLMSASIPDAALNQYKEIGFKVDDIKEDKSDLEEYNRERFSIASIVSCEEPSEIENLIFRCIDKGNAIIYANTVDRALHFYKWFENKGIEVCLYHSRFTEPDKFEKEKLLLSMLGHDSWATGSARGIAILTQIGEMSINISADIMISDLCPIDRLTQRVGRLCRFDKGKTGELHVLIPEKEGGIYPAPYGSFDRKTKSWISSDAFEKTRKLISKEKYSVKRLTDLLNQVYDDLSNFDSLAIKNANNLKEYFMYNWLLNAKQVSQKDDDEVNFWKSRNIPPQDTLFIKFPGNTYFSNYLSYQEYKLRNGVELPFYLIEKGKKNFIIDVKTVTIKEDKEIIYVIREGFYSFQKGVDLNLHDWGIID